MIKWLHVGTHLACILVLSFFFGEEHLNQVKGKGKGMLRVKSPDIHDYTWYE